jgi:MFS family permease
MTDTELAPRSMAVRIFLAFACGYFLSALLRAVTATLAPTFSQELGLRSSDLGLLAGAYFLGFSVLQLPLGSALDRIGPKRVLMFLLAIGVVGCAAFALAQSVAGLILARVLIGMGVAACLMAPLTSFRLRFSPAAQLRANSWMLMSGSLGMVASTLPVQWLLPVIGWRGLFWIMAAGLGLVILLTLWWVPADAPRAAPTGVVDRTAGTPVSGGYAAVVRHPVFVRSVPIGFFVYGGLIAVQSLWAGPWLTQVAGWTARDAAGGLFLINLAMLLTFMAWGAAMPRLVSRGITAQRLMTLGLPAPLLLLAWIILDPQPAGAVMWALWCVACTFVSVSQPAVGQAFPAVLAGRALSAYNLVIFSGVFCIQWGIGVGIDAFTALGWPVGHAFRATLAIHLVCCIAAYVWLIAPRRPVKAAAIASPAAENGLPDRS